MAIAGRATFPRPAWRFCLRDLPFLALGVLSSCVTRGPETVPLPPARAASPPASYMRIVRPDSNTVTLQIAMRQFAPTRGAGPRIWLVGASHVGESNYFASLQRHLDGFELVLFEGVGATSRPFRFEPDQDTSVQLAMARSLGLMFQLQAIHYDRPHFRNSDLTLAQLQQLIRRGVDGEAGDGRSGGREEFEQLLQVMDGSSSLGIFVQLGLKLIAASPKLRELSKLMLIETLGGFNGDLSQMRGMPAGVQRLFEVIIQERNKVVLADLSATLRAARPPSAIAVFYGAGHMADLEKRLRAELHYHPLAERWLTAMTVDAAQSGLSPAEVETMRGLVRWQLQALEP